MLSFERFCFLCFRLPDIDGVVSWPHTSPHKLSYMEMIANKTKSTVYTMKDNLFAHKVSIWNVLIPDLIAYNHTMSSSNPNTSQHKTWIFFSFTIGLFGILVVLLCVIVWASRKGKKYIHLFSRNNSAASYAINL